MSILDLPLERPDADARAAVFVPAVGAKEDVLLTVRTGAAIIGFGNHDRTVTVYFESNRFAEPSLFLWEHKARKAYDRMIANAPTVSKMTVNGACFEQVGYITAKAITIRRMASLRRWLELSGAIDTAPDSELLPRSR